jgi:hypothetical protein
MTKEVKFRIYQTIKRSIITCWNDTKDGCEFSGNVFIKHKDQKFDIQNIDEVVSHLCCCCIDHSELPSIKGNANIYVKGVEDGTSKLKRITYRISPLNYHYRFENELFEIEITDMTITSIS